MEEDSKKELKSEIEAILFAAGRKVSVEEIVKLCKRKREEIIEALTSLKKELDESGSSLLLIEEGDGWKLTVREKYLGLVRNIVPHTELNKALLETLAIIAWKQPVMQADVVKIRGSKSYEHIRDLLEMGFITKTKHGRSYILRPSSRFFDYFDLPTQEELKKMFQEVEQKEMEKRASLEHLEKGKEKKVKKVGDLEVYDVKEKEKKEEIVIGEEERLGKLETYGKKEEEEVLGEGETEEIEKEEIREGESEEREEEISEKLEEEKTKRIVEELIKEKEETEEPQEEIEEKEFIGDVGEDIGKEEGKEKKEEETEKKSKRKLPKDLEEFAGIEEEESEK
ncbi:MAG: SMC-Scp complex subunit ScpB [Candidatus Woesearchaeota archaeon]|nr:SMC-Scp complex subunit ScpB [Candidatus Woesearchaeota archaeon]